MQSCYISRDNVVKILTGVNQIETMTLRVTCILKEDSISVVGVDHDHNTMVTMNAPCENPTKWGGHMTTTSGLLSEFFSDLYTYEGVYITRVSKTGWELSNGNVLTGTSVIPSYLVKDLVIMRTSKKPHLVIGSSCLLQCFLNTSLCESLVEFSIDGDGIVRFNTCGELLAVELQLSKRATTSVKASCICVFKYIRSVLSTLQRYDTICLEIQDKSFIRLYTEDDSLDLLFFHHSVDKGRKRRHSLIE